MQAIIRDFCPASATATLQSGFAQKLVEMDIPLLSKEGKFAKRTGWLVKPRSHLMMIAQRTLLKSGGFAALSGCFATLLATPALARRPSFERRGMSTSTIYCAKPFNPD